MTKTENAILETLNSSKNGKLLINDLVKKLNLSRKTILKNINNLILSNDILKNGKGNKAYITINKNVIDTENNIEKDTEIINDYKTKIYEYLKLNDHKYTYDELVKILEIDKVEMIKIINELEKEGSVIKIKGKDKKITISFNHRDSDVDDEDSDEYSNEYSDIDDEDIDNKNEYIVYINGICQGKMEGKAKDIYQKLINSLSVSQKNSSYAINGENLNITIKVGTKG